MYVQYVYSVIYTVLFNHTHKKLSSFAVCMRIHKSTVLQESINVCCELCMYWYSVSSAYAQITHPFIGILNTPKPFNFKHFFDSFTWNHIIEEVI